MIRKTPRDSMGFHHKQLGFTKVLLYRPRDWWEGLLSKTSTLGRFFSERKASSFSNMAIGKIIMFHRDRQTINLAIFNSYVQLPEGRWLVFEISSEMYIDVLITRREDDAHHSWEQERFRVDSLKWDTLFHTYLAYFGMMIGLGWINQKCEPCIKLWQSLVD